MVRSGDPRCRANHRSNTIVRLDVVKLGHLDLSFEAFWRAAKITLPEAL
ncbi:hypothetical protein SAMN06273572_1148 [Monaibacterium marinum]|uniref:Uncharacterized protein n=1 Tax=Pontivivens marinum TaxID=1690039 RepID=A0A2C9CYU2_9RHOB|nr:hypothetical protein [Monaibacterium marinum]SOH95639.1 hypothetical protein SAMN06273572_1148 [Monaibacterium marinum]